MRARGVTVRLSVQVVARVVVKERMEVRVLVSGRVVV